MIILMTPPGRYYDPSRNSFLHSVTEETKIRRASWEGSDSRNGL